MPGEYATPAIKFAKPDVNDQKGEITDISDNARKLAEPSKIPDRNEAHEGSGKSRLQATEYWGKQMMGDSLGTIVSYSRPNIASARSKAEPNGLETHYDIVARHELPCCVGWITYYIEGTLVDDYFGERRAQKWLRSAACGVRWHADLLSPFR